MTAPSREHNHQQRLAGTLGTFFTEKWITDRGDDGLMNFLIDDEIVCMEFARSGYIEYDYEDLPRSIDFQSGDPSTVWETVLLKCDKEEMRAIAALLLQANDDMLDQTTYLNVSSGAIQFLSALGLENTLLPSF